MKKQNHFLAAAIIILAGICSATSMYKVSGVSMILMEYYHISNQDCGWLMTIVMLMGLVLALPAGGLVTKIGPKRIGIFSLACTLISNIIGASAAGFFQIFFSRLLEGFGFGLIGIIAPELLSRIFPAEKRGLPMAIWSCWVAIGLLISTLLDQYCIEQFGNWQSIWFACAIFTGMILILFCVFVQEKTNEISVEQTESNGLLIQYALLKPWNLAIIFGAFSFSLTALLTFAGSYMQQSLGLSTQLSSFYNALLPVGMILGGISIGFVLNKIQKKEALLLTALLFNLFCCGLMFEYTASIAKFYMLIGGFIFQLSPAIIFAITPQTVSNPNSVGIALGIVIVGQNIGGFGAVVVGSLIDRFGYHSATLATLLGAIVAFVFAVLFYKQTSKTKE